MIDKELLEILACPETKEPVQLAEAELITSSSRGIYAFVLGKKSEDHPDTGKKSDKKKSVFSTNRVIVLDLTALKLGLYQKLYN